MTTFEEQIEEFSLRPVTLVDVVTDFCPLSFGAGLCAPNSRELFPLEATSGWSVSADAAISDDDTFATRGIRSIKLDKTGGTEVDFALFRFDDLLESGDLTGRTLRIVFNVGTSLLGVIGGVGLYVRLGINSGADYYEWRLPPGSVALGVNRFTFDFDSPDATVGAPTGVPVDMRFGGNTALAGDTFTDGLSVDDFIVLSNNPQSFPCYNTRKTCVDPDHFFTQKITKTYRFSSEEGAIIRGAADGPTIIPAIRNKGVKLIQTKIDRERGYGRRDRIQANFTDFLDDDRLTDPYLSIRSRKPESTFFRKFLARNPFLKGRPFILWEGIGIDDPVTGGVRVNLDEFQRREYVIDKADVNNKGVVTFVAKDILKNLDGQQIPKPSELEILEAAPMTVGQLTLELEDGQAQQLLDQWTEAGFTVPVGLFYIAVEDESMLVTGVDTVTDVLTVIREQLGSSPEEHEGGSKVQLIQSWVDVRVDDIWLDIQIQSGIDPALIDFAGAQSETDLFLTEHIYTSHIREPTKAADLMAALNLQTSASTWWDSEDQVTRFKPTRPRAPGEEVVTWNDSEEIVGKSVSIVRDEESRITSAFVYFDVINWSEDLDKPGNYRRAILVIDADAENEDQYGDVKTKKFFNYFYPADLETTARSAVSRYVSSFRDPRIKIKLRVTTKDGALVKPGANVDIQTFGIVDFDGREVSTATLAVAKKRLDFLGIKWEFDLEEDGFPGIRAAFWAPDDAPDLVNAEPEDLVYAYWAGDDCLLPDGSDPYLWV